MYIKTFDAEDHLTGAEYLEVPVYVRWQTSNGLLVRCEPEEAHGIVSEDGNTIYLINGQMPHGIKEPYAEEITQDEYEAIHADDPEDDTPAEPDDPSEDPIMTRAQLTAAILELQDIATATKILLGVTDE